MANETHDPLCSPHVRFSVLLSRDAIVLFQDEDGLLFGCMSFLLNHVIGCLVFREHMRIEHGCIWPRWARDAMKGVELTNWFSGTSFEQPWSSLGDGCPEFLAIIVHIVDVCDNSRHHR